MHASILYFNFFENMLMKINLEENDRELETFPNFLQEKVKEMYTCKCISYGFLFL